MDAKSLESGTKNVLVKPRIFHERPPKVIVLADSADFKKVVQKLTGIPHELSAHEDLQKNQALSVDGTLSSPENPFSNGFECIAPPVDPSPFPLQQNPDFGVNELMYSDDFWYTVVDDCCRI